MKSIKRSLAYSLLALGFGFGLSIPLRAMFAHANGIPPVDMPGNVAALPQANGVIYEAPLSVSDQHATIRQALDAAEREFGFSDSNVDPNARVVPVILSIGLSPAEQHMKALVVTANLDNPVFVRPGNPGRVAHKLCIVIDAQSGNYIMAYAAGPTDIAPNS